MDICLVDIVIDFLSIAFHSILYHASVYPKSIFETRRKYGIVVYRSNHPEVNQYIDLCLRSIGECLKAGQVNSVVFSVTDNTYIPVIKFFFDFIKNERFDEQSDAYFIQIEQNLRAFCLSLSSVSHKFSNLYEDSSFLIHLHTSEATAVALATNPDLEDFPLLEVEDSQKMEKILPIRRFTLRSYSVDTYIELK